MDDAGILPDFKGTAVHDHWKLDAGYEQCNHALCFAPHLRELQYLEIKSGQTWATDMVTKLCEIKKAVDEIRPDADSLPPQRIAEFEPCYDTIVNAGYEANPRASPEENWEIPKKKGRPSPPPALNLLDRLRDFKPQVLAFMYDFCVPFDNNQAERDVCQVKVKQKVSGSFLPYEGAGCFARIRSYIVTHRKNAVNIFPAIRDGIKGKPFVPESNSDPQSDLYDF